MSPRYVNVGGVAVQLDGGGAADASDQGRGPLEAPQVDTATSTRTILTATASATPHSVSGASFVELSSSLPFDTASIFFYQTGDIASTGADTSTLVEVATGGSGSEVVVCRFGVGYSFQRAVYEVPGHFAAGTRISVRVRSAVASKQVVGVWSFVRAKGTVLGAPVSYGDDTATSRGVALHGAAVNTKGNWTEITASTSAEHNLVAVFPQAASATTLQAAGVLIDIGIGGSGAEQVIVPDLYMFGNATEIYFVRTPMMYGADIPAGSRLSARMARGNTQCTADIILVCA